jgi:hypothetical protein
MRKTVISLIALTIVVILFGSTLVQSSRAKGLRKHSSVKSAFQDIPGTRCTRLTFGPKEKKKPATAAAPGAAMPGTRCTRLTAGGRPGDILPNRPAKVGLSSSTSYLSPDAVAEVKLKAIACDLDDDNLLYTYSTTGGRITGNGAEAVWNLNGVRPGSYIVTVEVDDGCGCISFSSGDVTVGG